MWSVDQTVWTLRGGSLVLAKETLQPGWDAANDDGQMLGIQLIAVDCHLHPGWSVRAAQRGGDPDGSRTFASGTSAGAEQAVTR